MLFQNYPSNAAIKFPKNHKFSWYAAQRNSFIIDDWMETTTDKFFLKEHKIPAIHHVLLCWNQHLNVYSPFVQNKV